MPTPSDAPFLDAAPPAWAARALAWVLLIIFGTAVVGLVVVQVPETVSAPFVLVTDRGTDPVRSLHDGVVTEVKANDATVVEAGAPLFVIHSESVGDRTAERDALGATIDGGQARLGNERQRYENQRRADEQEHIRVEQTLKSLTARAGLAESQAALARDIADREQKSYDRGATSFVEASRRKVEAERLVAEAEQVRSAVAETRAALAQLVFQMASRQAEHDETVRRIGEDIARTRARKGMLDGESARTGNRLTVAAPCAGTVVRLIVRSAGTVVEVGDVLADVACANERLQAELQVPQRGLALVANGQPVKLQYDAFPYQRYGVKYATLRWISPSSSLPEEGRPFRALADLDEQALQIAGQVRPLSQGMGGVASIIIGRRSLASYAVEPLRQMREALAAGPAGERNGP